LVWAGRACAASRMAAETWRNNFMISCAALHQFLFGRIAARCRKYDFNSRLA
jgi:hypothetical protein